jgi:hypothetical protein
MPNKIKPKRSYTANAVPVVSGNTPDIEQHEMAVNWTDGKLFTRDANNQLVSITLGGGGAIPTASATTLGGVKVGSGLTITDGVLSVSGGSLSGSVTIPGAGDPYYSSVGLLLHGNGNLTDSGPLALTASTVTNVGTNGAAKFGSSSLVFDGTSRLTYANNPAWSLPGNFTVEAWIFLTTAIGSGSQQEFALAAQWAGGGGLAWLWYLKSDGFTTVLGDGTPVVGVEHRGSVSLTPGQWHHVAISRLGTTFSSYCNGARIGTYQTSLSLSGNGPLTIGDFSDGAPAVPYWGRIDEFRLTKGVARYTGDTYVVPAAAFPDSADLTLPVVFS